MSVDEIGRCFPFLIRKTREKCSISQPTRTPYPGCARHLSYLRWPGGRAFWTLVRHEAICTAWGDPEAPFMVFEIDACWQSHRVGRDTLILHGGWGPAREDGTRAFPHKPLLFLYAAQPPNSSATSLLSSLDFLGRQRGKGFLLLLVLFLRPCGPHFP